MSTSKLQKYTGKQLRHRFAKYGIVENTRPSWLVSTKGERLELDFYFERLGIAVEVQGKQHFEFTPVFHATEYDFKEQVRRDKEKLEICQRAGIDLLYVCKKSDIEIVLTVCYNALKPQESSQASVWVRTPQQKKSTDKYSLDQKNFSRGMHTLKLYAQMIQDGKKLKRKSCKNGALRIRQIKRAIENLGLLLSLTDRKNMEIVEDYLSR